MIITNNYGRVISCLHKDCNNETIGSFSFVPAFANAIDRIYIAYCSEHKEEAEDDYYKEEQRKDRINQAGSNS